MENLSCCSFIEHCDGIDEGHCNVVDHQPDFKQELFGGRNHRHPCHEKFSHHHCHSNHSMKSLSPRRGDIHYCESCSDDQPHLGHNSCKEECASCVDDCDSCALDVSFGGNKRKITEFAPEVPV